MRYLFAAMFDPETPDPRGDANLQAAPAKRRGAEAPAASPPPQTAERPESVGPFTLVEPLGSGAMGEVYLARDERLDRWVALKRVHPGHHGAESVARFRREARTVAKLRHPSIVQIHDLLQTDDGDWLVMERLEGESLDERLVGEELELLDAVHIAKRIAEGLAEAHARGVIHRDLKASNIMLTSTGVKILDFGLAKTLPAHGQKDNEVTAEGQLVGTIGAMAPEQAMGLEVDERADLFALGLLLYEMLAGSAPFKRHSALATLNAICDATPEPLDGKAPGLPSGLTQLVHQLLEKRPDDRPDGGAQEVVDRLRHARAALGGSSASYSQAAPPPEPAWPRHWRLWLAAAGCLFVGALLFGLFTARQTAPDRSGPLRLLVSPFFYSGLESHRFFSQGLGEEIRARLSALDEVLVISRLEPESDAPGTDALGADYRLDGTVAWPGDGRPVTVTLRLSKTDRNDGPIWEKTFEERPDDLLALQAKLAGDVTVHLPINVDDLERRAVQLHGTLSQASYLAYLEGLDWERQSRFSRNHLDRALLAYRHAIQEDQLFVDARARAIRIETFDFLNRARSPEMALEIHRNLTALRRLAPDATATRLATAEVASRVDGDHDRAVDELKAVLANEPNHPEALATLGFVQRRRGHLAEAIHALERTAELSPLDASFPAFVAETERARRNFPGAVAGYEKSLALNPGDGWIRGQAAFALFEWRGCTASGCDGGEALALLDAAPDPGDEAIKLHRFWIKAQLAGGDAGALADAFGLLPATGAFKERGLDLVSFPSRVAVLQRLGRTGELRQLLDEKETSLGEAILLDPQYPANYCFLSIALSIAGDSASERLARGHAETGIKLASPDLFSGPQAEERWAMALVLSGRAQDALPLVRTLLKRSYQRSLTAHALRHDPAWASLRDLPEGRDLISSYR